MRAPRSPFKLNKVASSRPMGFCSNMWMAKNSRLLRIAFQNAVDQSASNNTVWKLARPAKVWRPASSLLKKPWRKVSTNGSALNSA